MDLLLGVDVVEDPKTGGGGEHVLALLSSIFFSTFIIPPTLTLFAFLIATFVRTGLLELDNTAAFEEVMVRTLSPFRFEMENRLCVAWVDEEEEVEEEWER